MDAQSVPRAVVPAADPTSHPTGNNEQFKLEKMQNELAAISNVAINVSQAKAEVTPTEPIPLPSTAGDFELDENVTKAIPDCGYTIVSSVRYGESLWGRTAKITIRLQDGLLKNHFLKVVSLGEVGRVMCYGEFESLKAIHATTPRFCPEPFAVGRYAKLEPETYFCLLEFREIGGQPAEPVKLAASLARMHLQSESPTGKFGFHTKTCHAQIMQAIDIWDSSWCNVFKSHFGHIISLAKPILKWPDFDIVADLTLDIVVPRLLLPLQAEGRILKPCLVHGDCWDGNTAMDARTGQAFIFDVCSFYGHSEYDTGNWRAPRHRLSHRAYIQNYRRHYPVSEPSEDWGARNLLYSLCYNIGNAIHIPGSTQRPIIYEDLTTLCKMFCPDQLGTELALLRERQCAGHSWISHAPKPELDDHDEEEEEEEED